MKITHIWSISGVSQLLTREQRKLGHEVNTLVRDGFGSKFGFQQFYKNENTILKTRIPNRYSWKFFVWRYTRGSDIIHVHDADNTLPFLKKHFPHAKIILSYYGSAIRDQWEEKQRLWKLADYLSVGCPDLLDDAPEQFPLILFPVDMDHFRRLNPYYPNSALYMYKGEPYQQAYDLVVKFTKKMGLQTTILDRRIWLIPYPVVPRFLELFEYVFEIHQSYTSGKLILETLNLIGLQQLAMGGKVIKGSLEIVDKFDKKWTAENVAKGWIDIYESL